LPIRAKKIEIIPKEIEDRVATLEVGDYINFFLIPGNDSVREFVKIIERREFNTLSEALDRIDIHLLCPWLQTREEIEDFTLSDIRENFKNSGDTFPVICYIYRFKTK